MNTPALDDFRRIIVKVGSSLLVDSDAGVIRESWLASLAADLAALHGDTRAPLQGLTVGASLDLVTLDRDHPLLRERSDDEILDSWIFAGGRELIDCVWRAGERVVSGGRHRDRDALIARYSGALQRLRA